MRLEFFEASLQKLIDRLRRQQATEREAPPGRIGRMESAGQTARLAETLEPGAERRAEPRRQSVPQGDCEERALAIGRDGNRERAAPQAGRRGGVAALENVEGVAEA